MEQAMTVGQDGTSAWDEVRVRREIMAVFAKKRLKRRIVDGAMSTVLCVCAVMVLVPLFSILFHLISQGITAINLDFLTKLPRAVGEPGGGMANAIVGTIILLGIASLIGVPIGLGTGIYLSEYATARFARVVRFVTDVMNGIPSIVYGIFAYTLCVLPMKSFSAMAGGFALGIMMIPIVTRTTEDFVRMVPQSLREAALALGAPKWRMILDIVVSSARAGIVTGIMVSLARVAGETAPLLFTAFGNRHWTRGFHEPIAALPLQIFAYAISPFDDWHRQAWAGALVLIFLVFAVNLAANYFVWRQKNILSPKKG
ncbi:MAG: phosphate ABC transporter permease PstA [Candidatus Omnitrophota bacterium]